MIPFHYYHTVTPEQDSASVLANYGKKKKTYNTTNGNFLPKLC
jgi:hypothetical protein